MRVKCNKFIDNYQFCDGDDVFDFGSESTLEIGDLISEDPKVFIKSEEQLKKALVTRRKV